MFANLLNNTSLSVGSPNLQSLSGGSGGFLSGLSGTLGNLSSGGTIGAVTSLLSGITSLFKGSPPSHFSEKGKTFIGTIIPQIQNQYSNDYGKMLTEMSKAYNYMIVHYQAHLAGSQSERSRIGNEEGMSYVRSFDPTFNQFVSQLRAHYNITSTKKSVTFPKNFLQGIKPFSGNHQGSYDEYVVIKKNIVDTITSKSTTLSKGSSSMAGVGFMALILGSMFFPQIKKVLKIK
jgi:hypothetical protein